MAEKTKAQLLEEAKELGLEVSEKDTKRDILEKIDSLKPDAISEEVNSDEQEASEEVSTEPIEEEKKEDPALGVLREEAIKLGLDAEVALTFNSVTALEAMIVTLTEKKTAEDKLDGSSKGDKKRVKTLEEKPNPREESEVVRKYKSKKEIMRRKLEAQPKVRFFLPITGAERPGVVREVKKNGKIEQIQISGAVEVVQLNGYKRIIPKGVFVEVPEQIAEVLSDSMIKTQQAGRHLLIDRPDENPQGGGGNVSDKL